MGATGSLYGLFPSELAVLDGKPASWAKATSFRCGFRLLAQLLGDYRSQGYSPYPHYTRKATKRTLPNVCKGPNLALNAPRNSIPREMLSRLGTYLVWSTPIGPDGHLMGPDAVGFWYDADGTLLQQHTGS